MLPATPRAPRTPGGRRRSTVVGAASGAGPRATKLAMAMEHALNGVLKDCSLEKFEQTFPQLARDNMQALKDARNAITQQFESAVRVEFDELVSARQVRTRLNQLDEITEIIRDEQQDGVVLPTERPSPEQLHITRRYRVKLAENIRLQAELNKVCHFSHFNSITTNQQRDCGSDIASAGYHQRETEPYSQNDVGLSAS
eukprot:jgi/Hompol1/1424/HPOL_001385-RA